MIRIAVVGEIGSGKTFLAKLFGFPVFNADKEVAKIYKKNKKVYKKLSSKLSKFAFSFPIKKNEISNAIKNNSKNLKIVTNLIHPIVRKKMNKFLIKNRSKKAVVLDIPLYFENNLNKRKDIVIFIHAEKSLINRALNKRSKSNIKLLKKLGKLQKSLKMKKEKADYVIKNDFKSGKLKKKVKIIKNKIFNK